MKKIFREIYYWEYFFTLLYLILYLLIVACYWIFTKDIVFSILIAIVLMCLPTHKED